MGKERVAGHEAILLSIEAASNEPADLSRNVLGFWASEDTRRRASNLSILLNAFDKAIIPEEARASAEDRLQQLIATDPLETRWRIKLSLEKLRGS